METLHIKSFNPQQANEQEFMALNAFENRLRAEQWPEDPPFTLERTMRELRELPPFIDLQLWIVGQSQTSEIVARASTTILRTEQNKHLMSFDIAVLAEMRRQGIAKRLLPLVAERAKKERRRILQTHTDSTIPAGEAFMKRLSAHMGIASHTNQLNLAQLDRDLIRQWQERAPQAEFELGLWEGTYPQEEIESVAKLIEVMNTEPRDNLEMEDWHWSPEQLREWQASLKQRKTEQWTMYARERATRQFAGYTEVFWNPQQPELLQQGDTGVFPKYRNRGLGRWLKAAMLEKILKDRPYVKRIRTGNADSNAAMLKINHELGFRPYKSWYTWQVELDRVLEYLGMRRE